MRTSYTGDQNSPKAVHLHICCSVDSNGKLQAIELSWLHSSASSFAVDWQSEWGSVLEVEV